MEQCELRVPGCEFRVARCEFNETPNAQPGTRNPKLKTHIALLQLLRRLLPALRLPRPLHDFAPGLAASLALEPLRDRQPDRGGALLEAGAVFDPLETQVAGAPCIGPISELEPRHGEIKRRPGFGLALKRVLQ